MEGKTENHRHGKRGNYFLEQSDYEIVVPKKLDSLKALLTERNIEKCKDSLTGSECNQSDDTNTSSINPPNQGILYKNYGKDQKWNPNNRINKAETPFETNRESATHDKRFHFSRQTDHDAFYYIKLVSQEFHLHLLPSRQFLHKNFKIHRRKSIKVSEGSNIVTLTESFDPNCFYTGSSVFHEGSSVALNICNGLQGTIRTNDTVYLIHPAPSTHHNLRLSPGEHPPHVMYKHEPPLLDPTKPDPANPSSAVRRNGNSSMDIQTHSRHYECGINFTNTGTLQQDMTSRYKEHEGRMRRSLPSNTRAARRRTVETIVVVDQDMLRAHGEQNVTTYVLTVLNMVSNLFHDNSIGSKINITLVALILLEGEEPGLQLGHQAGKSLTNFCQWQSSLRGVHHDHAILLTGVDICSYQDSPCDTLGFAPIEGMCKRYRSCTINEDTGLGTAFTIAHELGHNLGMFHDGEGNYCNDFAGSIMAPTLLGHDGMFKWSACSRKYLNNFLRSSQAWCLSDEPKRVAELSFPDKLPGELYNADIQCKWQFGREARLCMFDFAKDLCKSLWCFTGGTKCETKFLPAAEGTSCGPSQWCRKGVCVRYGDAGPSPVDGGWGAFSDWSTCTRTCSGGVKHKERICNHPRPQYGGKVCEGESRVYKKCNMQECVKPVKSFRSIQCESYNSKPFRGWYYKWKPYTDILDEADICRLYCKAERYDFYFALSEKVVDGTPCREGSDKICIEGVCMPVGCDDVVDSGARRDICGVCRGDNSTCHLVQGVIKQNLSSNAYHAILTIPQGARSIRVSERTLSPSYLAVRLEGGRYFITGGWRVSWPGEYQIAGTTFTYNRPYNEPETLVAPGPITENIVIEVLVQGPSPSITYAFTVAKSFVDVPTTKSPDSYTWSISTSHCSSSCAGGRKTIAAKCLKNLYEEVPDNMCQSRDRPTTGVFSCNTEPCPPRWTADEWSHCSQSCGGGKQRRRILCIQKVDPDKEQRVRSRRCQHLPKPARRRQCNEQECPPQWVTGSWSKCTQTCGDAKQMRSLSCRSRYKHGFQELPSAMCDHLPTPSKIQACDLEPCDYITQWFLSSWSKCSKSCGSSVRQRTFKCTGRKGFGQYVTLPNSNCSHLPTPKVQTREPCHLPPCTARWFVSPWSKCSKSCGRGTQSRLVRCIDEETGRLSSVCPKKNKPSAANTCVKQQCDVIDPNCLDTYDWCSLIPVHNLCGHQFYGGKCCESCQIRGS